MKFERGKGVILTPKYAKCAKKSNSDRRILQLSIHFGEDKTKSIIFSTKNKKKKIGTLEIKYGNINIKQYSKATYLGCELDENLSGEAMALKVINKINARLRFLYRKNRYLSLYPKRLLCNAIIQPHFDYACSSLVSKPNQKIRKQIANNADQMN